ncbi:MAG: endolytic transglycosylase MltG [Myxococcales bacterium]|nr:endolytic transglycosylase MltG [Myxococcales bacterium]
MRKALPALLALGVLAALGGGGFLWSLDSRARAPGQGGADVELEVPKGANARSVAVQLEKAGLIPDTGVFRYVVWKRGGFKLKAGKFRLSPGASPLQLADALEQSPLAEDEPFVVVEGFRLRDTDAALAAAGRAEPGAYLKAASSADGYHAPFPLPQGTLEGYLYPETYNLPEGKVDVRVLVQKQLDEFAARVWTPLEADVKAQQRSLHELVTMASMLEREEPTPSNRPLVAGILWKRIEHGWPLGVDATSRYELAEWNDRQAFLVKLRDRDDPYNTRFKKGLPPTPIGAPTKASFEAALKPTASEYLYYLHDANKALHPSRNAEEHEALRKKYDVY